MAENRVSAALEQTDLDEILTSLSGINTKLPFLVDLSSDEKRELVKFGDKSVAFVKKAVELVNNNEDFLPRSFDVDEFKKDVELYDKLYSILQPLRMLAEKIEDTHSLVGSEAYSAALLVYQQAKLSRGELGGLNSIIDDLGKRFIRKSSDNSGSTEE
ncbi:MAG: hypothetical protein PVH88_27265 [Ignavibacteria bacterium]|jgi:hypothetical protein